MDVFGLLGNPVGHSLSPPIHEAAYEACGIDASYVTFEPAVGDLGDAIDGAQALGVAGLNVTIPFKEDTLKYVEPDTLASRIGAVNTIDFGGGQVTGHNTDAAGVRRAFEEHDVELADATAVVVGAGGAGRAISFALADAGATVRIANRTVKRAERLADAVPEASACTLDELPAVLADATVLANATSVGMEAGETPVPANALHSNLTVFDAVYQPLKTRLLRDAAERGATTIDGAWMLLFQAVEAFELWMDEPAPIDVMNQSLQGRL